MPTRSSILLLLITSLAISAAEPDFTTVRARPADEFVDSLGVNIHLGYGDTIYKKYDELVKPRLLELGLRHVRDGLRPDRKDVVKKLNDLAENGIHSDLIVRAEDAVVIAKACAKSVATLEGLNEPDGRKDWQPDWPPHVRAEQEALYKAVKADPETAKIPVLVSGMANTRNSPGKLGDLKAFLDYGNMHSYPGGLNPLSGGWGITLTKAIEEERKVCGDKPIIATETGYHNNTNQKGHPGVSEDLAAKYLPRLFLHYFNQGFKRVYSYEFLDLKPEPELTDMEKHFGLIRNDGTPKPAFEELNFLINLLKDPGETFQPNELKFKIADAPKSLETTLLQKRDGRFYLILWLEESFHDPMKQAIPKWSARIDFATPPAKVMSFNSAHKSGDARAGSNSFTVALSDSITVLELTPAK